MAWIESNKELSNHPKVKRAAKLLNISIPAILGHLHLLWYWCLDYAQEGDLSIFDSGEIADACLWTGDPDLFVQSLVDCGPGDSFGFLELTEDNILTVHDWMDYAGRLIEKRGANADRMRQKRAEKKRATHVQRTCVARAGATVPNLTVPNLDINNNNNNAREDIEMAVNDSEENVIKTAQNVNELTKTVTKVEESVPMAIGTRAIIWAEKNWGRMMSPGESGEINAWCDEFATRGCLDPDAVVIEALKQCDYASVRNMKYLRAVLTDWRDAGVLTVAHVKTRETERKSQKEHKRNKDQVDKASLGKYDNFYL